MDVVSLKLCHVKAPFRTGIPCESPSAIKTVTWEPFSVPWESPSPIKTVTWEPFSVPWESPSPIKTVTWEPFSDHTPFGVLKL